MKLALIFFVIFASSKIAFAASKESSVLVVGENSNVFIERYVYEGNFSYVTVYTDDVMSEQARSLFEQLAGEPDTQVELIEVSRDQLPESARIVILGVDPHGDGLAGGPED